MKLVQFFLPGKGKRVGLVQGDRVLDITSSDEGVGCTLDLVVQGKTAQGVVARGTWLAKRLHRKALDWRELQRSPSRRAPHLLVPIDPPEVWGAKGTYAPEPGQRRHRPDIRRCAQPLRIVGRHCSSRPRHIGSRDRMHRSCSGLTPN